MLYTIKHGKGFTNTNNSYRQYLDIVNKDTLLHIAKMLELRGVAKSHSKDKMSETISSYVLSHPIESLSSLNSKELQLLKDLVQAGANTHVFRPSRKFYKTLKHLLFVSVYHDKRERRLYFIMPDELRELFAPHLDKLLKEVKKREKVAKKTQIEFKEPKYFDDEEDDYDFDSPIDKDDEILQKLKTAFPMIDFDEIYGLKEAEDNEVADDDEEDEDIEADDPRKFSYSCSQPMIDDIRALNYKAQAEVCKALHKMIKKGFPMDDSFFIKRFEDTYCDIIFSHLDDSIDQIHYAINDLDNAIYEIDIFDPMTFFDIESKLAPIIKRNLKKGEK